MPFVTVFIFPCILLSLPHFLHGLWLTVIIKKHRYTRPHGEWRSAFHVHLWPFSYPVQLWPGCSPSTPPQLRLLASSCLPLTFQHRSRTWLTRVSSTCCITSPMPTVSEKLSANFIFTSFLEGKPTENVPRGAWSWSLLIPGNIKKKKKKRLVQTVSSLIVAQ